MKFSEIKGVFKDDSDVGRDDIMWLNAACEPFTIHGLYNPDACTPFTRMPVPVAKAASVSVAFLNTNTAGGRVRFITDSPYIAIRAKYPATSPGSNMTLLNSSGFDLYADIDAKSTYIRAFMPPLGMEDGYSCVVDALPGGELVSYTINFPTYNAVDSLEIGLAQTCTIEKSKCYKYDLPVVYYGSSITQGGCASHPGNTYQAIISRELDCDYVNLGFSGSARAEACVCEYMASLDMSVFVCDYDHNAPDTEHLLKTHRQLYDTIRLRHMNTPYIIVTKPDFENGAQENAKRREIIHKTYEYALAYGDKNVYFVDGETLFGTQLRDACTVDGCHPNDLGFARMSAVIGPVVKVALESVYGK